MQTAKKGPIPVSQYLYNLCTNVSYKVGPTLNAWNDDLLIGSNAPELFVVLLVE